MKVIATVDDNNVMVQLTKKEFAEIIGECLYGSRNAVLDEVFKGDKKPHIDLIPIYEAMQNIKRIPTEIYATRKKLEESLKHLDACVDGLKLLPVLSTKIVKDTP